MIQVSNKLTSYTKSKSSTDLLAVLLSCIESQSTYFTIPLPPSTSTRSPVLSLNVASRYPTTAGIPNSLATITAWDNGAPMSVIIAEALGKSGDQPIFVATVTRIYPSINSLDFVKSLSTRTVPSTIPADPA